MRGRIKTGRVSPQSPVFTQSAMVDFMEVANAMAACLARRRGGNRASGPGISNQDGLLHIETERITFKARNLISCAGLYSDEIARLMGIEPGIRVIPSGEYYNLRPQCKLVRYLSGA